MLRSRSDSPFIYIFIDLLGDGGCILYRIDALKHLCNENKLDDDTQLNDLQPLLVFPESLLPFFCHVSKLGSNFYFLGSGRTGLRTFGIKGAQPNDVYMLRESDLMDLDPSEHNTNAEKYLIKTGSMLCNKDCVHVFVADNKLYVLSNPEFEVYSPECETWKALPPYPYPKNGVISYVVVGKTVYFSLYGNALLSFQLDKEKWGILVVSPPLCPNLYFQEPWITSPLVITGDKVLGFLNDSLVYLTVCASPLPQNAESVSPEFMRPSIAPTDEFSSALDSSCWPHRMEKSEEEFSGHMIALDGVNALCVISYVSSSMSANDRYTNYATLTFFEVSPGFYREKCGVHTRNVEYANEKVDGEYVATRYFKAKLLHSAKFVIKTSSLRTWGRIKACFY